MSNTFSITFKSLLFIIVIHLLMKHFSTKFFKRSEPDFDLDLINSSSDEELDDEYNKPHNIHQNIQLIS